MSLTDHYPIEFISISDIDIGDQLIRSTSLNDGIEELALDIAAHGLLQPIGVTISTKGRYQLLWGYRRLHAFKHLRRTTIPARIVPPDQVDSIRSVAIRENIHRSQLSLQEEIETVQHMHDKEGLSPAQIAERIGKTRDWVLRRLAIPSLPDDVRDALLQGDISLAVAEALAVLPSEEGRAIIMCQAKIHRWSAAAVAEAVKAWQSAPNIEEAVDAGLQKAHEIRVTRTHTVVCDICRDRVHYADVVYFKACAECAEAITSLPRVEAEGGLASSSEEINP